MQRFESRRPSQPVSVGHVRGHRRATFRSGRRRTYDAYEGRKSRQVFASFFANSIAHPCAVGSMMRVPTRIVRTRPATWTRSSCLPAADVRGRLSAGDAGGRRWHRNHDGEADAGRFPTPAARHEALRPYGSGEQSPLTRLGRHPLRLSRRRTPRTLIRL